MPKYQGEAPATVWGPLFEKHRPDPARVRNWVTLLHGKKEHQQVIALIGEALKNGQSQPWMYEVLALSQEIENYPKAEIERSILSMTDFGNADFGTMMYSGAYLARLNRNSAALKMYKQCSRMLPERPEPYVLGLKLASKTEATDDIQWAACGVIENYWNRDYVKQHQLAEDLVFEQVRRLKRQMKEAEATDLVSALKSAGARDLLIRVEWTGGGDIDLLVEEPSNTICSFETPQTRGGGILLHDGSGPDPGSCYESYACPKGLAGPYRITIRQAWGKIVGERATITVTKHAGTPEEDKLVRTLILEEGEARLTVDLDHGRRKQPREGISWLRDARSEHLAQRNARGNSRIRQTLGSERVVGEFAGNNNGNNNGAFSVSPVVQLIPEGSSLTGNVVVSPDRRYVRLSMQPVFSNITDVFTFSYLNSGN